MSPHPGPLERCLGHGSSVFHTTHGPPLQPCISNCMLLCFGSTGDLGIPADAIHLYSWHEEHLSAYQYHLHKWKNVFGSCSVPQRALQRCRRSMIFISSQYSPKPILCSSVQCVLDKKNREENIPKSPTSAVVLNAMNCQKM